MQPDIFLHMHPTKGADRGILIGETGTGKSTAAKVILQQYRRENPKGRTLIADTKPRWRATRVLGGRKPLNKRYAKMVEGDQVDSMILDKPDDWMLIWDPKLNPSRTVIVQPDVSERYDEEAEIQRQVRVINKFFRTLDPREPSFLYIDEGMDFFGPTGNSKYGPIINKCYRAGRERGLATLMAVQRPRCISQFAMSESNVKLLFALGTEDDETTLYHKGFPRDAEPVDEDYEFRLVRDRKVYPRPLVLDLGE